MYFEEFELGMTFDIPPVTISKEKMLSFAYDYDNLPIHTDEEYASKTHFKRIIAPGVMPYMSVWTKFAEGNVVGEEMLAGLSTKINWHSPVFADDVLKGKAVITKLEDRNEKNGMVEITFEIHNQDGVHVITDVTELVMKKKNYRK